MNVSNQQEGADSQASDQSEHDGAPAVMIADGHGDGDGAAQRESLAQVPSHTQNVLKALELLYEHFPRAFVRKGEVRPLKIGVFDDLRERIKDIDGLSVSKVRAALRIYTSRLAYQRALQHDGARRIDLDGNECGEVDSGHVAFARERSEAIRNARREKLKAARTAESDASPGTQPQNGPETGSHAAGEGASTAAAPGAARREAAGKADAGKARTDAGNEPYARPRARNWARSPAGGRPGSNAAVRKGGSGTRQAVQDDLRVGAAVLVQSSHGTESSHTSYVRGVISRAEKNAVMVTLQSGMTVSVPHERLRIETTGGQSKD